MEKNRNEKAKKAMAEKKEEISQKMRKNVEHSAVVMSGKVGVGKSTVAANIAKALTMRGHEVGLMGGDLPRGTDSNGGGHSQRKEVYCLSCSRTRYQKSGQRMGRTLRSHGQRSKGRKSGHSRAWSAHPE